jgi:hypothetical protein
MAARKHLMDKVKKTVKGVIALDNLYALLYLRNISMLTWYLNKNREPN